MPTTPPTFPLFARLPIEIRHLIWAEYLAPYDRPTMYLYSKNLFLRHLDPDHEDERYAGISHTPLVQVATPPSLHVSAEARGATLGWARPRGISLRWRPETRGHVLARALDPARDALYVSRDKWDEFCELSFEGDGLEETTATVRHLALPAFTAYFSYTEVAYLMAWFTSLESVSAVWGPLPELKYARTRRVAATGHHRHRHGRRRRRRQQNHLMDTTTDDGTDTGVDPVTGELEEGIAAEVQPRWVLEDEADQTVRMCVQDPLDGSESWEVGEREEWMGELEEALMTTEVPEHVFDAEGERFLVEMRAVRARREG